MRATTLLSTLTRPSPKPWTCTRCLQQASKSSKRYSTGGTGSNYGYAKPKRRRRVVAIAATGTVGLGATVLAFGDDAKHAYKAAERTGRVVSTLAVCINE